MTRRAQAAQARADNRAWVVARRERTYHLIELGGLVAKAGLVELVDDDRAVLLGAFLSLADVLGGEARGDQLTLWRRRGKRAFALDAEMAKTSSETPEL